MKSIRLSLIVYLLVLVLFAFAAVSWQVYRTTSSTLRDRQASMGQLLKKNYDAQSEAARAKLDQHLYQQALKIANLRYASKNNYESKLLWLGVMPSLLGQQRWVNGLLAAVEWGDPELRGWLYLQRTKQNDRAMEHIVATGEHGQPQEYYQTRRLNGDVLVRSNGLSERKVSFNMPAAERLQTLQAITDTIQMPDNTQIRYVTIRVPSRDPPPSRPPPSGRGGGAFGPPPGGGRSGRGGNPFAPPARPEIFGGDAQDIVIQFASDLSQLDDELTNLRGEHDQNIITLDQDNDVELDSLRAHLAWIGGGTFFVLFAGGFFLVQRSLAPLSRLSEAVSQISEKDFRLKIDSTKLPSELQPIVGRLTRALDELQQAFTREKQASADISHELRTPLAALLTTIEVAMRKSRTPEEYRELLEECHASGKQMYHLVERLMTLARLDARADRARFQMVDVGQVAKQCISLIRPLADQQGLSLVLDAPQSISVKTDSDKLREVLNNLLHNAIEYNKPNGGIKLTVDQNEVDVVLCVSDTGIGITPAAQKHIFERFYRADPSRHADSPHAGLGLSIVKSYIELLGGKISVESSGEGTTFQVAIPISKDPG